MRWLHGLPGLLLVATLLLPTAAPTFAQRGDADLSAASLAETDCVFLVGPDGEETRPLGDISCGILSVPENWRIPDGRRLDIRYVVLHATADAPAPDPVLYLEGGPGGAAIVNAQTYADLFAPLRSERDVILFDQRGTGFSSPLHCAEWTLDDLFAIDLSEESVESADAESLATPEPEPNIADAASLPLDPEAMMEAARVEVADGIANCAQQLISAGIDLRQYNSIASANDAVALLRALGYEHANLYGISYGTRLALVIARDHPNAGIRSIVLDSTFPPEIRGFEQFPAEPHEVVIQLFADCALDAACSAAYPDLKQRFIGLLETLETAPIPVPDGTEISQDDLVNLMQALNGAVGVAPWIPRLVAELETGDTATWVAIRDGLVGAPVADESATPAADEGTPVGPDDATPEADANPIAELAEIVPWHSGDAEALSGADLFLSSIASRAHDLPLDDGTTLVVRLLFLSNVPPTRESLEGFVRGSFPEGSDDRAALLGLTRLMADAEVADLFDRLQDAAMAVDPFRMFHNQLQFLSVECNEEIPFQRFEETLRVAQGLEIPELGLNTVPAMAGIFASCEVWPSGRAPEIEGRPVASDIPTMIFAGAYDLQTPVSWNKSAFVHLPNASFVLFPMAGHGAILYSDCAAGIANAFIADPRAIPDESCVATLRPQWAMPDDPLPAPEALTPEDAGNANNTVG